MRQQNVYVRLFAHPHSPKHMILIPEKEGSWTGKLIAQHGVEHSLDSWWL